VTWMVNRRYFVGVMLGLIVADANAPWAIAASPSSEASCSYETQESLTTKLRATYDGFLVKNVTIPIAIGEFEGRTFCQATLDTDQGRYVARWRAAANGVDPYIKFLTDQPSRPITTSSQSPTSGSETAQTGQQRNPQSGNPATVAIQPTTTIETTQAEHQGSTWDAFRWTIVRYLEYLGLLGIVGIIGAAIWLKSGFAQNRASVRRFAGRAALTAVACFALAWFFAPPGSSGNTSLHEARQAATKVPVVPIATDKVPLSDSQLSSLQIDGRHIKNVNAGIATDIKFRCTFYWKNGAKAFEQDQTHVLWSDDEPLPSGQTINFDKYDMTSFEGQVDELDEQATKCQVTHAMVYRENTQNVPLTASFGEEVEKGRGKHDITALVVNETDAVVSAPQIYVMCVQEGKVQPPATIGQLTFDLRTPRNLEYLTLHMTYTTDSTITVPAHSHIEAKVIGGDDHFLYADASAHSFCWIK
jgi:hypothetical protein